MIIGHVFLEYSINYGVSIIDFRNQKWFPCPSMNINYMTHSKGALGFHKNVSRFVVAIFMYQGKIEEKCVIKSYNIEKGTSGVWKTLNLSTNHVSPSSLQWHRGMIYLIK